MSFSSTSLVAPRRAIFAARAARCVLLVGAALLLSACATRQPFDYTAFKASRPRSILVLPPVNQSPEVDAPLSFLSGASVPLGEAGYYVIPIALAAETFKQNGVTVADEAQNIPYARLRKIFGADAALYITIERFGTSYRLIESVVEASAHARLVDLRSGQEIWNNTVYLSTGQNNSGGGLIGMLVNAAINQITNTLSNKAHQVGRAASYHLLSARKGTSNANPMLYGPYHALVGTD
ncbi:lipoprotein [Betaproteobacteria bacterium]|nr:lipoprotein [Betaproteobacteria bacterium]GHU00378.1 lipoprotein [Betaproteobacteria bacterium]GHU26904.1 lipoprotein [Betaproteobacteria bacterium]